MTTDMAQFDGTVRLAILRGFLDGSVPSVDTIATSLGVPVSEVRQSFDRLAGGRAIVLVPGTHDIRMAAPFAGQPTDFRTMVARKTHFANCIWDAMGIPAMLHATEARIETICSDCSAPLHLELQHGEMRGDASVVHFAVPAARWWEDIVFT